MSEAAVKTGVWERRRTEAMGRIQRTALDLFDKHGYRNVTVEKVAAAAGVSANSIYRYFGTKEMLVLYDEYDPRILELIRTAGDGAVVSPAELISTARLLAPVLLASMLTPEAEQRIRRRMSYAMGVPDVRDGVTRQTRELEAQLRTLLADRLGRGAGDLAVCMTAANIAWVCSAALDHWAEAGFVTPLRDIYAQVIESILRFAETVFEPS